MREFTALAITGIPGSGKTELAVRLAREFGWFIISTGDIARRVDPEGLAKGKLADEASFRLEFLKVLGQPHPAPIILDGIPRSPGQATLLPPGTLTVGLTCREDVAVGRQMLRGREGDTIANVVARTEEQTALLEQNVADGFIYRHCGYGRVVNTSMKRPEEIAIGVIDYLTGLHREVF